MKYFFLLFLGLGLQAAAQTTIQWDKTIGSSGYDNPVGVRQTADGGYVVAGRSNGNPSGHKSESSIGYEDYWVVKLDANRNKLWDKTYGSTASDVMTSFVETADGGFLFAGTTSGTASGHKAQDSKGSTDYWVVRTDALGNLLWERSFGSTGYDYLADVAVNSNGDFLLGGYTYSSAGGDKSDTGNGGYDFWIVKIDAQGNKIWDKTLGGSSDDFLSKIVVHEDGQYLLAGYSYSNASFDKSEPSLGGYDFWVIKTDAQGNRIWDRTFGGSRSDLARTVIPTSDGGYLIGGSTDSYTLGGPRTYCYQSCYSCGTSWNPETCCYTTCYNVYPSDYYVVKINGTGSRLWARFLGGYETDNLYVLAEDNSGYLLAGYSNSPYSFDKTSPSLGGTDNWLVKLGYSGAKMWDRTIGGQSNDAISSAGNIGATDDGGFIIASESYSQVSGQKTESPLGGADFWLIKFLSADAVPPQFSNVPQNISAYVDPGSCTATVDWVPPSATDNVGVVSVTSTHQPGASFPPGPTTVTYTARDAAGNQSQASFTVTVADNIAPVPTIETLPDIASECSLSLAPADYPTATDNCGGTITATTEDPVDFTLQGSYVVDWTYTDQAGNVSTQSQRVVIQDITGPLPDVAELPVLQGDCSIAIAPPTASDNCSGAITATTDDPFDFTDDGTYVIHWKYTDQNGNETFQEQTVVIDDVTPPVMNLAVEALPKQYVTNEELEESVKTTEGETSDAEMMQKPALKTFYQIITAQCTVTLTDIPTAYDKCSGLIHGVTTDPLTYSEEGTYIVTWKFDDGNGNESAVEQTVIIDDTAAPVPDADALPQLAAECGLTVTAIPTATDNCGGTITATTVDPLVYATQGTFTITWLFDDGNGNSATQAQTIVIDDVTDPTIAVGADITVANADGLCGRIVSFSDPVVDDNCGAPVLTRTDQSGLNSGDEFPVGETVISYQAEDAAGNIATASFTVTVTNAEPEITSVTAPIDPQPVGSPVTVNIAFNDNNVISGSIDWGDGSSSGGSINGHTLSAQHTYFSAGVYTLQVLVTDACQKTASAAYQYLVLYDPSGGFVTGGGWFTSPPGAYTLAPEATGKASFGFVSRYRKGSNIPEGNTDFQFQAGGLKFKSTEYEWLVIAGHKAMYKGVGDLNGSPGYGFLISAVDGDRKSASTPDKFRIKIWDAAEAVVYDNQLGSPDDAEATLMLGGGSIVIHDGKSTSSATTSGGTPVSARESSTTAFPNPFTESITLLFNSLQQENLDVQLIDVTGKPVYEKTHRFNENGIYSLELNGNQPASGVYMLKVNQGRTVEYLRMIKK